MLIILFEENGDYFTFSDKYYVVNSLIKSSNFVLSFCSEEKDLYLIEKILKDKALSYMNPELCLKRKILESNDFESYKIVQKIY